MAIAVVGAKGQKFPLLGISFLGLVDRPPQPNAASAGAVILGF